MYMIDEETLYNGKIYNAILAREDKSEAYIKFLQPREKSLKCQELHNNALSQLLEDDKCEIVIEKTLSTEETY